MKENTYTLDELENELMQLPHLARSEGFPGLRYYAEQKSDSSNYLDRYISSALTEMLGTYVNSEVSVNDVLEGWLVERTKERPDLTNHLYLINQTIGLIWENVSEETLKQHIALFKNILQYKCREKIVDLTT